MRICYYFAPIPIWGSRIIATIIAIVIATPIGGNDTVSEKPSQNHQNKPRINCRGFSFSERGKTSKKEFGYKSVIKASKLDIKKGNKKGPKGPISCLN